MDTSPEKSAARKRLSRAAPLVLILSGAALILSGLYLNHQAKILSFNAGPELLSPIPERQPHLPKPVHISISNLGIELPVEEGKIVNGVWEISPTGASHLDQSANPGEGGNIIIYGHNKNEILGNLINAQLEGSRINILTEDGKVHEFKINKVAITTPEEISYVLPSEQEVLTLYTCTGFLDSKRLIIRADPIESGESHEQARSGSTLSLFKQ